MITSSPCFQRARGEADCQNRRCCQEHPLKTFPPGLHRWASFGSNTRPPDMIVSGLIEFGSAWLTFQLRVSPQVIWRHSRLDSFIEQDGALVGPLDGSFAGT
jgi:hypothetical protein